MGFTNMAGTLLGPLTTTWSMPAECSVHVVNCATCDGGFRGQKCSITKGEGLPFDNTSCWPPAIKQAGTPAAGPIMGWGFYSPGLACPTGYVTACQAEYGEKRPEWEVQFSLVPGETAIGCCPEGFKCTNRNGNTCLAIDTQVTASTAMCSGTELVNFGQVTYPAFVHFTTTVTQETETGGQGAVAMPTSQELVLMAPMFQLNFQSSDLAPPTTPPPKTLSSPSESSVPVASKSTDSNSASSDPLPPAAGQDGLSTGAAVGIGVGAAIGGILLGMLAIILFMRHRKRKGAVVAGWPETQAAGQPQYDYKYPAEMSVQNEPNYAEMMGQQPYYDGTTSPPTELSSGSSPWVELPTGSNGWNHSQPRPTSGI
ncbi:hypothetical protein B0I37DRAFT_371758 [Chaetomium sp. MPI-CAGE-AT-0009]|nr:hypothetical protein B0I37DRAFT_371758 [Chaetomium sp. MPI-CAGE-AT-0009]